MKQEWPKAHGLRHKPITANWVKGEHVSLGSLHAQSFVSIHSICLMGVFWNGSQCLYLLSQSMETSAPLKGCL